MGDFTIFADNISVKYCTDLQRSLKYGLADIAREFNLWGHNGFAALRKDEMWALKDATFSLKRGECLGVIGPNGAGKSTLLKVLAGIFKPDAGKITVRGRTCALLQLGAGFNFTLTGRENVYINGSLLGMSRREIDRKYKEIVEFSEVGDFMESPVRNYSAGMSLRLAFSIAIHVEPDLLLIDEILAVGDVGFRAKCIAKVQKTLSRCAVVFVSHSMSQVAKICTSVMTLDRGNIVHYGKNVPEGIEKYFSLYGRAGASAGVGDGAIVESLVLRARGQEKFTADGALKVGYMSPLEVSIAMTVKSSRQALVSLLFYDRETRGIAQLDMRSGAATPGEGGRLAIRARIPGLPFAPGRYLISISVVDKVSGETLHTQHNAAEFQMEGDFHGHTPVQLDGQWEVMGA